MPHDPLNISLIIPAYNEEHYLGRLLDSVQAARARYPGEVEVIVVDNGSTDRTREIALRYPVVLAHEPTRCIACVRNRGGRMAKGAVIAFCDADNVVDERIFEELDRWMGTGLYVAGSVKIKFERISLPLALTMAATNTMPRLVGFSGGFVFCTREAYLATGGYDENIYVTEDAAFLKSLRFYAKDQGKCLAYILSTHITTSTRKFDQRGDWFLIRKACLNPRLWGKQRNPQFAKELWYGK